MTEKKKLTLTQEKMKDLAGFEEVLDLFFDGQKILTAQEARTHKDDTFEIYSFLEKENSRLQQLDNLFSQQMNTHEFYGQTSDLCEQQALRLEQNKSQLIEVLSQEESPLQKNLSELFKKTF